MRPYAPLDEFPIDASSCQLHLSARGRYFVDGVCLLLPREGVLDLSEEQAEGGSRLEHRSDVEVLTHPPDPLPNATHVREVDSRCPLLSLSPSSSVGALGAEAEPMKE